MAQVQIRKVSVKHEAIADWLLTNPQRSMEECARHFGITRAWLSVVVNSQAFREMLALKGQEVFEQTVVPLRDKLNGVAHRAVEKLGDVVDNAQDPKLILDIADRTLHRLGYAPSKGPTVGDGATVVQQNNFYQTDPETLRAARERMLTGQPVKQEGETYDALPASEEV